MVPLPSARRGSSGSLGGMNCLRGWSVRKVGGGCIRDWYWQVLSCCICDMYRLVCCILLAPLTMVHSFRHVSDSEVMIVCPDLAGIVVRRDAQGIARLDRS